MTFLVLCVLAIVSGAVYAFYVGLTTFNMSENYMGQRAVAMIFLGINLCEPLINTFIIGFFIWVSLAAARGMSTTHALLLTSPMAVLLIPAYGLSFREPFYLLSIKILLIGSLRWVITASIMVINLAGTPDFLAGDSIVFVAQIIGGSIVLWFSAFWGAKVINNSLQDEEPGTIPTYR